MILFNRLTIIGVGLLGASLARAMRERGLAGHITDSDGQPVEGARVHVYDHVQRESFGDGLSMNTDSASDLSRT